MHLPKTTEPETPPIPTKEMPMSRFANLYRDMTCAAAAVLITLVISLSFVESTSAAPFNVTPAALQAPSA
jgi:hypothetical protein